jgi:branched-subunit amino acid ABC-type transport system permease component
MKVIFLCFAEVVFIAGVVALCFCQLCKDIIREVAFDVFVVLIIFAIAIEGIGWLYHF